MRCEEIQERFVDLLYAGRGTPPASPELQAHIDSCPGCRRELEGLQRLRGTLNAWQDEPPLRPVQVPLAARPRVERRMTAWNVLRFASLAALVVLAFLALANAEFSWDREGFAFKTRLFPSKVAGPDYYTKAEVRDMLKRALDDSEARMMETNSVMIDRMMDTMDQERWQEWRLVSGRTVSTHNKN